MDGVKLTEMEQDALRECANVGIGNAATSLSILLKKRINIKIPEVKFIPIEKFSLEIGGPETVVSGIYLTVQGDLQGEVIFIFPKNDALELVCLLLGNAQTELTPELSESGFKEMSNIVTGSYLNALANMLDLKILPSIPHTATDMAGALIDFLLSKVALYSDNILAIKTEIYIDEHSITGTFIIIFSIESLNKIMDMLHDKYGV
ncbi:MAG: chemotaxis protein CheC [archaeon]